MNGQILDFLPQRIKYAITQLPPTIQGKLEEIRIRIERPLEIRVQNASYFLTEQGTVSLEWQDGMLTTHEEANKIMNLISRHSLYAIEEELRRGYITVQGGHRVGITGRAVVEEGKIKHLKDIRSFNIRMAREYKGIGEQVLPYLIGSNNQEVFFYNTLIISPPGCGKTTLLRDLTRLLSYGSAQQKLRGQKVGIVDERSEIASCIEGVPQNDLGPRIDVLDACPKAEGMILLIRSMSPDVIVTDEIGSEEDTKAILEALHAGAGILTTAHGHALKDIHLRPSLRSLFEQAVFERYVLLSRRQGAGTVECIFDRQHNIIFQREQGGVIHA